MCGSFRLKKTPHEVQKHFNVTESGNIPLQSGDFEVGQTVPVIGPGLKSFRRSGMLFWGFGRFGNMNARAETVDELPTFRTSFATRRVIVPATGWIEHNSELGTGKLMGLAAIYSPIDSNIKPGLAILTRKPPEDIKKYHNRMPVVLTETMYNEWLNLDTDLLQLKERMAMPYDLEFKKL